MKKLLIFLLFFNCGLINLSFADDSRQCCTLLNEDDWQQKEHIWNNRVFYTQHYNALFYIPLNIGKIISTSYEMLDKKGLLKKDGLILCRNESFWGGEICIEITETCPDLNTVTLSGHFISKFYEGSSYKDSGSWHNDMKQYVDSLGLHALEYCSYYATCPDCKKKFGKVQTVIFAKIE